MFQVLQLQKGHYFYQYAGGYFESDDGGHDSIKSQPESPSRMLEPWEFNRRMHMSFCDTEPGLNFHLIILKKSKDTLGLNGKSLTSNSSAKAAN